MTKGIFITGTDTDVGKTIVTAGIMHILRSNGYNATYFKAALSGALEEKGNIIPGDTSFVSKVSKLNEDFNNITPYIYKRAVSPHLAAKLENNPIDINTIKEKYSHLKEKYDYIVAEGSGGIVCPLIDDENGIYLLEDLIKDLNMDVIIVTRAGLGTINHTVITIKYIQSIGINVKGIIVNGYKDNVLCNDNIRMIKKLVDVPILGIFNWIEGLEDDELSLDKVRNEAERAIDLDKLIKSMGEI